MLKGRWYVGCSPTCLQLRKLWWSRASWSWNHCILKRDVYVDLHLVCLGMPRDNEQHDFTFFKILRMQETNQNNILIKLSLPVVLDSAAYIIKLISSPCWTWNPNWHRCELTWPRRCLQSIHISQLCHIMRPVTTPVSSQRWRGTGRGCGGVGIQGGGGDRDRGEDTTERLKGYMGYCSLGRIGNQFSLFK
jgi:hypothetical protein